MLACLLSMEDTLRMNTIDNHVHSFGYVYIGSYDLGYQYKGPRIRVTLNEYREALSYLTERNL
jgi:hypothetical protein